MTTDEIILALVERHGFTLPRGLHRAVGLVCSRWWTEPLVVGGVNNLLTDQQAHDLCACEFARQVVGNDRWTDNLIDNHEKLIELWDVRMTEGDSAAAIRTLYEAMEGKQ